MSTIRSMFDSQESFEYSTIVSLEETNLSELIYAAPRIQEGSQVLLKFIGYNVKDDLRYEVSFGKQKLGVVTISSYLSSFYQGALELGGQILSLKRRKNLPPSEIDLQVKQISIKKAS